MRRFFATESVIPINTSPALESASIHESAQKTSHKAPAQISPNIQQLPSGNLT
jgi:hypothetical protein